MTLGGDDLPNFNHMGRRVQKIGQHFFDTFSTAEFKLCLVVTKSVFANPLLQHQIFCGTNSYLTVNHNITLLDYNNTRLYRHAIFRPFHDVVAEFDCTLLFTCLPFPRVFGFFKFSQAFSVFPSGKSRVYMNKSLEHRRSDTDRRRRRLISLIFRFISTITEYTVCCHQKGQSENIVEGNNRCLSEDSLSTQTEYVGKVPLKPGGTYNNRQY